METRTRLGHNRTGVQMSPFSTVDMKAGEQEFPPDTSAERGDLEVRMAYAAEAERLGSVPPPATPTGMVSSAADMLTGDRPQVLMDKLGERLAFERSGVRLYDSLLVKCRATDAGLDAADVDTLASFRDQEWQHFELLADSMRDLGGDPTAQTPCADLVGVEGMGLMQAISDPRTTLLQGLHVILDAELIDNTGWEMLINLARSTGHDILADRFEQAAEEEDRHLETVKALVERLTLADASLMAAA